MIAPASSFGTIREKLPAIQQALRAHGLDGWLLWRMWPWGKSGCVGWRSLEDAITSALAGQRRVAMELSLRDAVPVCDRVPAGVAELARSAGVVSSALQPRMATFPV